LSDIFTLNQTLVGFCTEFYYTVTLSCQADWVVVGQLQCARRPVLDLVFTRKKKNNCPKSLQVFKNTNNKTSP